MSQSGWNPQGIVQTMQILKDASGPSGGQPSFLSSHPDPGDRAEYLAKEIREKYSAAEQSGKLGATEFQANVMSRRRAALPPVNLSRPVAWCFTCQTDKVKRVVSKNEAQTPTELLRDATEK
jgi:predicted Zn-dependent protease